jgi:hypothetical protein
VNFLQHDQFYKELKKLSKKHRNINTGLENVERLLEKQFDPSNPEEIIAPGKIHRVKQNTIWSLWKIEVVVPGSGLKPNQWPRMWFALSGDTLVYLCVVSHTQNYDNNMIDSIAMDRASDFF